MWALFSVFWKCQIAGWAAFVLFSLPIKIVVFGSVLAALATLYRDGLGFLMTLGMHEIYRRITYRKIPILGIVGIIAGLSLLGGLLEILLSILIHRTTDFHEPGFTNDTITLGVLYYRSGLFACWSLFYFGLRLTDESITKDSLLVRATASRDATELHLLRSQVSPHFLFNALNTIRYGLENPGTKLKKTVQSLADYLRFSLDHGGEDFVSLGEEYDAMRDYLKVEQTRFGKDLTCDCQMEESLRSVPAPGIILQPLVENAIKYGRETSDLPLQVKVSITQGSAERVQITVSNSGYWLQPNPIPNTPNKKSSHLGLQNLRRRLELLYSREQSLHIDEGNGWVSVEVQLPLEPQAKVQKTLQSWNISPLPDAL